MASTIEVQIRQAGRATGETVIRGHKVLIDRPVAKDGDDRGPMGGELILAGLGGCFMSNLLAAIRAREADVSNCQVDVTATVGTNPSRFTAVELRVSADCRDSELLRKLVTIAERGCIAANTLREAVALTVHAVATEPAA